MRKNRVTAEQIIGFITQVETGMTVAELGRQHELQPRQLLRLAGNVQRHGAEDAKRLKELESENRRLKGLLTESHLDIDVLVGFCVER